jgi:hypothetical protein
MFKRFRRPDGSHCLFSMPSVSSHWHVIRTQPYDADAAVNPEAVVGSLTIGQTGNCTGDKPDDVAPGDYYLSAAGTKAFAHFRVTPGTLPRTGAHGLSGLAFIGSLLISTGYAVRSTTKSRGA